MLSIKPGPLQAVNPYGRANGNVAQFISFLEKWVRANGVHQGNEENKESCPAPARGPGDALFFAGMEYIGTVQGAAGLAAETPWYKRGVIYELHVRAFYDSNGDGTGDFPGLTLKLDYLRDLGVTALWVLPFYPSPLKDDGYDIADYYGVHPHYGTLGDFKVFLREAHRRGLRIITELVLNHTSDQHPWFQRARRAPPGSRWRDFYVWSDTAEKYGGARVIFKDAETSNWTWDGVANAYYWHRFYAHQPDLNFDHPAVQQAMLRVVDFWLGLGVDGLRLDAVPYLFEREGTSCENLPETHEFLKRLRRHVDERFADRMLLAEANQWPEDAAAYFGAGRGDECQMAFHFPLMPRLFMALRLEDRIPIVDILEQTPPIPETAQWALFLRNHDELTLEMVTDEERDYMYRIYARAHQARLNLGIRRRLAPLVGNDRRRIELLAALLFSLPGTPVIYYGDEIGMGDNVYLGDRDGVRTPMQWSADKNAGFSRANPQSLYLPINLDPENHYEAVNVEVQEHNPHSLLWWMKRLIALQKRWPAFGLGTLEFLHPENHKVLAFVRRTPAQRLLVVANLSRFVQPAELDLSAFQSLAPVELFGHKEFPPIGDRPYFLTLGPHAFYLFSLEAKGPAQPGPGNAPAEARSRVVLEVQEAWEEVFQERNRAPLERALQDWLPLQPWFGGRSKVIRAIHLQDQISLRLDSGTAVLAFLQVEYPQGEPERCLLPLAGVYGEEAQAVGTAWPGLVLARLVCQSPNQTGVLYEALASPAFCRALLGLFWRGRTVAGRRGGLTATPTAVLRWLRREGAEALEPSPRPSGHHNAFVVYGERLILKWFRRLEAGTNPELDVGRFLTARRFPHTPALAGALEYRNAQDETFTVAVLSAFVPGCKNAWDDTLDTLSRFYERIQTLPEASRRAPPVGGTSIVQLARAGLAEPEQELIGTYLEQARQLGRLTAALHLALASEPADPDFAPEPFTPHSQRALFQSMRNLARRSLHLLGERLKGLPPELQAPAQAVLGLEARVLEKLRAFCQRDLRMARIRVHGNYHLGQVLHTGKDFWIVDFEGESTVALGERRLKRSPLWDVAEMLRSFHYAAHAALWKEAAQGMLQPAQQAALAGWAGFWSHRVGAAFFAAYRQSAGAAAFLPANDADLEVVMEAYLLRRAIYEVGYDLEYRPDWVGISLQGLLELVRPLEPA
jgi:maltose alpha-D-glucosyltransferase/alpha-amylase